MNVYDTFCCLGFQGFQNSFSILDAPGTAGTLVTADVDFSFHVSTPIFQFGALFMDKNPSLPYNLHGLEVNTRRVPNLRVSSENALDADLPVP